MSLNCPTSPVYRTSAEQKLQSKNAAKRYRYGNKLLRDTLREKCRIRIRDARQLGFEQSRLLMQQVLRDELAEIESDLKLQEEIYKELEDELNDWYLEQFEEEEKYIINVGEDSAAFCPICQRATLEPSGVSKIISCKCGSSFFYDGVFNELVTKLQSKVEKHEQNCAQRLIFFIEPNIYNQNILNAMCDSCDFFCNF
ncbi:RIP-like protein [Teleopsis dalmanni]|uniref:RIP-like protein n=1 Tax=Teleopsis dalmanni TaxID=139649 RepID=UPI0018CD1EDC|nr:RIP-like protein [Teleopsis dalmanni]